MSELNQLLANCGLYSKYYDVKISKALIDIVEKSSLILLFGTHDKCLHALSQVIKYYAVDQKMIPSPQMGSMAKIYQFWKVSLSDNEAKDILLNRVIRPKIFGCYFFDATVAKMFLMNDALTFWFKDLINNRYFSGKKTLLAISRDFNDHKRYLTFIPNRTTGEYCGDSPVYEASIAFTPVEVHNYVAA